MYIALLNRGVFSLGDDFMTISIFNFLANYYGIYLNIESRCSHKDIQSYFKEIETCSIKYAKEHPYDVSTGRIIYVEDTYGHICAYINPKIEAVEDEHIIYSTLVNEKEDALTEAVLTELDELNNYELGLLLSKYKKNYKIYRIIKEELIKRGVYENKKFKIKKEIDEMNEERDYCDKYQRRRKVKLKKS